jgi:integrase
MQKSLLLFHNAIKSETTRGRYQYRLDKFIEYVKLKEPDDLLQLKDSFLQELVEGYLFYLKKTVSPNSIASYMAPLELFFAMNDKNLNWKKTKKMYPATIKRTGSEAYSTDDIKNMLRKTKSLRLVAMIHFLASTACRVGVLAELKMKHLADIENCKAFHIYEGTNEEYWAFLTPEATKALDDYLNERKNDGELFNLESPLFRTVYTFGSAKAKQLSYKTILIQMWRIVTSSVHRVKVGKIRYNKQMDHAFRKRFNTILKDNKEGNIALKEKMMGHTGVFNLDGTYHVPGLKTLFEEFKLHILNLTISDEERLRQETVQKQEEIDALAKKHPKVEELVKRIEDLEYGSKARQTELLELVHAIEQRDKAKEYDKLLGHLGKIQHENDSQDEDKPSILEALVRIGLELRAPEKQKREMWKKLKNLKEGETMSMSDYGPSNRLRVKNFYDDGSDDDPDPRSIREQAGLKSGKV